MSLLAFGLRVPGLSTQSLWRDEVDAIRFSTLTLAELLRSLGRPGHNGPFYFLLLRGWRVLTGESAFALRFFSVTWGVLMVPLLYVVARRLGLGRLVGLAAALLVSSAPYLVWYSQEAKMYTLLPSLVLLATAAYLSALRRGRFLSWVVFVAAASLSFYTHILAVLMVPVYVGLALVFWGQRWTRPRSSPAWGIAIACLTVPYLPLAAWQWPLLRRAVQAGLETGHRFYPLSDQIQLLLRLYYRGLVRPPFEFYATVLSLFLLLAGLILSSSQNGRPIGIGSRLALVAWVGLPVVGVYLVSRQAPVFEDRYLIYIAPAFYLLIALGLAALRRYSRLLALFCLGTVLAINLWGVWQQATLTVKADFRAAAQFIERQGQSQPLVVIQMPYLKYTFDYYFEPGFDLVEGIWTNDGRGPEAVAAEMEARLEGAERVWLVVSEEEMWDRRALTRSWLAEYGRLVAEAHFTRVDVYQYALE
jgi:mannosyltransferase